MSRDISPNSRASLHLPPLSRQIPIPTLISPAMDGFLTTLASAAQIWPAGSLGYMGESTCVSPRGRLNRRRTMGVYGAIELRVLYIGHYGNGVYDCNRLHYGVYVVCSPMV